MIPPQKPSSLLEFDQVIEFIQVIIDDEQQRRELLETKDDIAQEWLDLLQVLAEYPNLTKSLRSSIFTLMIRLSRKSALYPQCLTIRGVEKLGDYPVGGGAFGDVWQGRIEQQVVCLKVIRAFRSSDVNLILKDFMQEGILWRQLNHPNVLPFMGIYYLGMEQKQLCLVSPWMERGNLVDFMKSSQDPIDCDLLAYDVANGLSYLHAKDIVHGDLKAVNILVTPDLRACIGDFGLSRVSATQLLLSESSRPKGTTRWLAPELLRPGPNCVPSRQSDVYAYACVCYEIFSGQIPFYELAEATVVCAVLLEQKRPSRPDDREELSGSMWDLMVTCWNESPSVRPTMSDVLARIHEMNPERQFDTASDWSHPAFTQIWNDPKRPSVIHTGGSIPPRSAMPIHGERNQTIAANSEVQLPNSDGVTALPPPQLQPLLGHDALPEAAVLLAPEVINGVRALTDNDQRARTAHRLILRLQKAHLAAGRTISQADLGILLNTLNVNVPQLDAAHGLRQQKNLALAQALAQAQQQREIPEFGGPPSSTTMVLPTLPVEYWFTQTESRTQPTDVECTYDMSSWRSSLLDSRVMVPADFPSTSLDSGANTPSDPFTIPLADDQFNTNSSITTTSSPIATPVEITFDSGSPLQTTHPMEVDHDYTSAPDLSDFDLDSNILTADTADISLGSLPSKVRRKDPLGTGESTHSRKRSSTAFDAGLVNSSTLCGQPQAKRAKVDSSPLNTIQ